MKILVSDPLNKEGVEILKKEGFEVDEKYKLPPEELKKIIKDYDALVVRSETKVTADIINASQKLKVIGRAGVGLDNVDHEAASKKGIIVMNTPEGMAVIDFGLGSISHDGEDKGTDIVMMKKALGGKAGDAFEAAYLRAGGKPSVVRMCREIGKRGRYMERG